MGGGGGIGAMTPPAPPHGKGIGAPPDPKGGNIGAPPELWPPVPGGAPPELWPPVPGKGIGAMIIGAPP